MKLLLLFIPLILSAKLHVVDLIKQHEGFRATFYKDGSNRYSIGYGTHLPLTRAEAELLLTHRLAIVATKLKQYSWYTKQNYTRRVVLVDMAYNLGISRLLKFKTMIWCLQNNYYHAAANAMRNSLWCRQTKNRCKTLSKMMWRGK